MLCGCGNQLAAATTQLQLPWPLGQQQEYREIHRDDSAVISGAIGLEQLLLKAVKGVGRRGVLLLEGVVGGPGLQVPQQVPHAHGLVHAELLARHLTPVLLRRLQACMACETAILGV